MTNDHAIERVMATMRIDMTAVFRTWVLALMLILPGSVLAADQRSFPTPEAAVDAVLAALKGNDENALLTIFGQKYRNLVISGDRANDAKTRADAAREMETFRLLEEAGNDRRILLMGAQAWPMPIPLVRENGSWRFATEQGAEEMLNRRVGRNERNAIQVLRAYLDAQREYASTDRDNDGVLQYAQKIGSAAGKRDGLYWPADASKGDEISPFGPLIAEATPYLAGHKTGDPYRGYYDRILTRQGKSAPGGAYNYVINGRMIAGFGMVAYPAVYGETGVMTFIVNHNGRIYQRDFGKSTPSTGAGMAEFDPTSAWKLVTD